MGHLEESRNRGFPEALRPRFGLTHLAVKMRLPQLAALAARSSSNRSRRGPARIALAALAIISPARRPNEATSTGAGGPHERHRSSFSCRPSGGFCVCSFRMGQTILHPSFVPIPDRSIPFPHRHALDATSPRSPRGGSAAPRFCVCCSGIIHLRH